MRDLRVLLYDRSGDAVGELSSDAGTLLSRSRSYEINGEHSMSMSTAEHIDIGTYALTCDDNGTWEEWAVDEVQEVHDSGDCAIGTYHLVWSMQYDLQSVCGDKQEPGMKSPTSAPYAIAAALDGTKRWQKGRSDLTTESGVLMFQNTAWDRLTAVVKRWGGEVGCRIIVGETGVTARYVDLIEHLGSKDAARRFEWGHDLTSIRRTPDPGPYYCRVIPLGNGETEYAEDDVTTFEWKIGIEEVNYGVPYLRDRESEVVFRVADGKGDWEYPTTYVSYSTDDEEELLALAKEDLLSHTRPKVSYEGTVAQFAAAGMNVEGIALGDEVQVVDHGFNRNSALRVEARIIRMDIDDFTGEANLTIGRLTPSIERTIANVATTVGIDQISQNTSQFDASKYKVSTPTLPTYTIDTPSAGTYTAPTYDVSIPDYSSAISDIAGRVSAIEAGSVSGSGVGGDGWTHQIDGVTQAKGTVNFSTAATGDSDSGSGQADPSGYITWGGSSKSKSQKATINWGKKISSGSNY